MNMNLPRNKMNSFGAVFLEPFPTQPTTREAIKKQIQGTPHHINISHSWNNQLHPLTKYDNIIEII